MANWNPWHGCRKYSEGCQHCYVYRIDSAHGKDASQIFLNKDFDLPMRRRRDKSYLIPPGSRVYTCFSSDFLLEEADPWRDRAWEMIRWRSDLQFLFITKRILRLQSCLPPDWGEGYENVHICCTVENQRQADIRLPVYCKAPIRHKSIICSPLLGPIDLRPYLSGSMEEVVVGGESGRRRGSVTTAGCWTCGSSASRRGYPFTLCRPARGCSRTESATASQESTSTARRGRRGSTFAPVEISASPGSGRAGRWIGKNRDSGRHAKT